MLDNQKKIRNYTTLSMSISIMLYGFSITLGALLTQISVFPGYLDIYLLITPPLSLLLGNILFGRLADKFGRKPILVFTPILFSIGTLLFLISNTFTTIIGVDLFLFSIAGGDEPAIISYSVENLSGDERGKLMMLITNFVNIGALISSLIFLIFKNYLLMKITISSFLFISLITSYFLRKGLPESNLWKNSEIKNAKIIKQNPAKLLSLLLISISTILTYGLISWVIGPYYYPNITSYIIMFFNLGNIIGGILGFLIIDSMKRNSFVFFGFLGGIITSSILLFAMHLQVNYAILFSLLLTNGLFTQLTWGSRLILEGELFSTKIRASSIALIRGSGWIIYIISTILTLNFSIILFQLYDIVFWFLGLSGSLIWFIYGFDTRKIPIEKLDKVLS